jgi:hypothetical protein
MRLPLRTSLPYEEELMKTFINVTLLLAVALAMTLSASAAELKGVTMPEELKSPAGKSLLLNGMGLREKSVMGIYIKVYVGGLYLEKKSCDANELIASPQQKLLKMTFKRGVKGRDLKEAWADGFKANCGSVCDAEKTNLEKLQGMLPDVKEGDALDHYFTAKGVELKKGDQSLGKIESAEFAKIMLSTWLGEKPVTQDLKKGLLSACK